MPKKNKHEYDDYTVTAYRTISLDGDWDYHYYTCNWFKALLRFIYLNFKYPKHTIRLNHFRYYD